MNIKLEEIELNYIYDLILQQKNGTLSKDDRELCNNILYKIERKIGDTRIRMSEQEVDKLLNKKI